MKKRRIIDIISKITTYIFSSFGVIILISIMSYVFINGTKNLSWEFLTSDYQDTTYNIKSDESNINHEKFNYESKENEYFSSNWGIALIDSTDVSGNPVVEISYIDVNSSFNQMIDVSNSMSFNVDEGLFVDKIVLSSGDKSYYALSKNGA